MTEFYIIGIDIVPSGSSRDSYSLELKCSENDGQKMSFTLTTDFCIVTLLHVQIDEVDGVDK